MSPQTLYKQTVFSQGLSPDISLICSHFTDILRTTTVFTDISRQVVNLSVVFASSMVFHQFYGLLGGGKCRPAIDAGCSGLTTRMPP